MADIHPGGLVILADEDQDADRACISTAVSKVRDGTAGQFLWPDDRQLQEASDHA